MSIDTSSSRLIICKYGPTTSSEFTFTIQNTAEGVLIQADVVDEGKSFSNIPISGLPNPNVLQSIQKIVSFLQERAVDFINGKAIVFFADPLSTYQRWKEELKTEKNSQIKALLESRIFHLGSDNAVEKVQEGSPDPLQFRKNYVLLGDKYLQLGCLEEANSCYQKSLHDVYVLRDNHFLIASVHGSLGVVYKEMGDIERSLRFHKVTLQIGELLQNDLLIAKTHFNMGSAYMCLDDAVKALPHHQKHFNYAKKIQDQNEIKIAHNNMGTVWDTLGQFKKALDEYKEALALTQDLLARGDVYLNVGATYNNMGNYGNAISAYSSASDCYKKAGVKSGNVEGGLANVYSHLGEYGKALKYHQEALKIYREKKDLIKTALALANMGTVYDQLHSQKENQLSFSKRDSMDDLSLTYWNLAVESYKESLEIARKIGHVSCQCTAEVHLSESYFRVNKHDQTLDFLEQATRSLEHTVDPSVALAVYRLGGRIHLLINRFEEAKKCFDLCLKLAIEMKSPLSEGFAYYYLGIFEMTRKAFLEASKHFRASVTIFAEMQRKNTAEDVQKGISFFETIFYPYRFLEKMLLSDLRLKESKEIGESQSVIAPNPHEEILQISDSGRATALVNLLRKKHRLLESGDITFEEIQGLSMRWQTTLIVYSCDINNVNQGWCWIVSAQGQITYKDLDLSSIWKEMEFSSKRPSYLRGSLFLEESKESLRGAEQISEYLDWMNEVDPLRGKPNDLAQKKQNALKLWYNILIKPIEHFLPNREGDRLTIIPDSVIHQLPFEAFTNSNSRTLIDQFAVQTIPSMGTFLALEKLERKKSASRPIKKACIIANPEENLEGAGAEGEAARSFFSKPLFFNGKQATKAALIKNISSASHIHLACHGHHVDSQGNPFRKDTHSVFQGALSLADELFFAEDLMNVTLNADLVVLSACESGKGSLRREGVVGLPHAFLAAGASTVIATRWKIPDAKAKLIVESFYKFCFKETEQSRLAKEAGRPFGKVEALREAILVCKKQFPGQVQAWGGFFLTGLPDRIQSS
jgi:tetratricopeptide (TPR) repeat protein